MASTDGDHYPERLGTLIVVNAPAVLSWAWKAIQNLLDDVQRAKIGIYGTDPNEWMPVLQKIVDRKQIPVSYGGPWLDRIPMMTAIKVIFCCVKLSFVCIIVLGDCFISHSPAPRPLFC